MIKENIYRIRDIISREGFSYDKIFIVLFSSAIITYILVPKFSQPEVTYRENDIAISDIVVEQDILLEDEYASNLKKENLIKEMPIYLDYNPNELQKLIQKINVSFRQSNEALQKITADENAFNLLFYTLTEEHALLNADIARHGNDIKRYSSVKTFIAAKLKKGLKRKYSKAFVKSVRNRLNRVSSLIYYHQKKISELNAQIISRDRAITEWKKKTIKMGEETNVKREKVIRDFSGRYGIILSEDEGTQLIKSEFSDEHLFLLINELKKYFSKKIIDPDIIKNFSRNNSLYISENKNLEILKIYDVNLLPDIRKKALSELRYGDNGASGKTVGTVGFLLDKLLRGNLQINQERMDFERKKLNADTDKVYIRLESGDLLAKRGQRLNAKSVYIVNEYYTFLQSVNIYPLLLGIFLLCCTLFGAVYVIFTKIRPLYNMRFKNITMVSIICVFHVSVNYAMFQIIRSLSAYYLLFDTQEISFYALPVSLAPMLAAILIGFEGAIIVTLISSLFLAVMSGSLGYISVFYALTSGIFSAYILGKNYSRIDLLVQGMKVSLLNIPLVMISMLFYTGDQPDSQYVFFLISPLVSGITSAIVAMFLYPLLEVIFDITTDLKLLELSNIHHPALRNLMVNAPGSYQHSIMVGTLAEAGAIKVGRNSLLCRVSAYYHDIGKTKCPEYFIENVESERKNAHLELNDPYKSADAIINHVTEGVVIAKKYNLGKAIIDMILQHHGTGLAGYFYGQAVERALAEGKPASSVDKRLFRYSGPKPQTIEAAIVMLADSCEAATRSLPHPTRENIEKMIHKIGRQLLSDGQLDESGISLKDFQNLIKSFTEMLATIYHKRVPYPDIKQPALPQGTVVAKN